MLEQDYSGSYSSVYSFCLHHSITSQLGLIDAFSDMEEIAELVGDEYTVLYIKDLRMGLRNEIYSFLGLGVHTIDEDILVIKNEQYKYVSELIMQSLICRA